MIREVEYLRWALARAQDRNVDREKIEEYLRYVRNACTMIATSGAAQTLAFMAGKGGVHKQVVDDLLTAPGLHGNLLTGLDQIPTREYMRHTRAMRQALLYLKRAAEICEETHPPAQPAEQAEGDDAD